MPEPSPTPIRPILEPDHAGDRGRAALAALYALAREACTGARVLDIAPEDGAGAALLAGWGARAVETADLPPRPEPPSPDDEPEPGPEFLQPTPAADTFGLVLALGHRPPGGDERALLSLVRARLAPGGAAIVRFPVAAGEGRAAASAVSALARETLGAPTQILVGMAVSGVIFVDSEVRRLDPARGILDQQDIYSATRIPGGEGRIDRTRDIVMAWGLTLPDAAAIAYEAEAVGPPPPAPPARRGLLARLLRRRAPRGDPAP